MRKKAPLQEVDPLALPLGTRVGPWRVTGFRGRGAYGTLYRAERVGHEEAGPAALKLAVYPGDERFKREAWLLRHIHSPFVPGFLDAGEWEHRTGVFPYVVMELVEGEPLYDWAARRNPTERQALGLLAQVARAVADTHAVGAVHRDVKGGNVLVRWRDGRAFLTDFGAGHYRGAASLTSKLLPPGTVAYRSPEAWEFLRVFRRLPVVHYPASACDGVGLLLAVLTVAVLYRGQEVSRTGTGSGGGDIVAVGDSASGAAITELSPMRKEGSPSAVGLPMPEKPFPGQRTPPCNRHGEVVIRGGCWYLLGNAPPPCKEDAYDWNGACYLPSYPARRQPTSQPP